MTTSCRLKVVRSATALGLLVPIAAATAIALPVPASAQTVGAQPDRTVFGVRILGSWNDESGLRWTFVQNGFSYSAVTGTVMRPSTGEQMARVELKPGEHGLMGEVSSLIR